MSNTTNRMRRGDLAFVLVMLLVLAPAVRAEKPTGAAQTRPAKADAPAATQPGPGGGAESGGSASEGAPAGGKLDHMKTDAASNYAKLSEAFLQSRWADLDPLIKGLTRQQSLLTPEQREGFLYIRKTVPEYRPAWWKNTASPSNISFPAEIWGRKFQANYVPSRELGVQGVNPDGDWKHVGNEMKYVITKLNVSVTWKPSLVDNPNPARGKLAVNNALRMGDLGEVIIWHEMGHNFITNFLPLPAVLELYENHSLMYQHLQEFYADMTALRHASPKAQRVALQLRLEGLDYYDEEEPHTRAAHGIGALVLAHILENPDKWPSVHLPPAVPAQQVELNTLIYVYEHWSPGWSLAEYRALRDMVGEFMKVDGDKVLRSKGMFPLPNKTSFSLMVAQDREFQAKRDAWVAEKLKAAITSGRADKPVEGEKYEPRQRAKDQNHMMIRIYKEGEYENQLRIEIPW